MTYEYVFSALGMMKITKVPPPTKYMIEKILNNTIEKYKDIGNIGLLYNAMTEANHGEAINSIDLPVYADSGGLQLAILGLDQTKVNEKKKQIFQTQANHSQYGFIFDEMPIIIEDTLSGDSNRVDNSNRIFIREMVKKQAILTAENVKQQIEAFDKLGSKSQVFIIGQGNDYETFNEYISTVVNHLSEDEQKFIRGIAPSDTCFGLGSKERWDLLFQVKNFDIPDDIKKNIHLLGVGATSGFEPVLLAKDYFSFIDTLSFDSSSHSRRFQIDGQFGTNNARLAKNNPTKLRKQYEHIYSECKIYLDEIGVKSFEEYIELATYLSSTNVKDVWSYHQDSDIGRLAYIITNLVGNIQMVEKIFDEIKYYKKSMPFTIRDYQDYKEYEKHISRLFRLKTRKVVNYSTLEEYNLMKSDKEQLLNLF